MLNQLTAEQGLRAVTVDAAHALGDESRRGRLRPGMLGDVTILGGDVRGASADEIRAMTLIATIVPYQRSSWTRAESGTRPPARFGAVSFERSAG